MQLVSDYCTICGGSGYDIDGNICECIKGRALATDTGMTYLDVPYQYRGLKFDKNLVSNNLHESYANLLNKLHTDLVEGNIHSLNLWLSAPPMSSKTVFVNSTIQELYSKGYQVFPFLDVMELRRVMQDSDYNKKSIEINGTPVDADSVFKVPVLFVKVPADYSFMVFDTIKNIIDRRRRVNNGVTFFISDVDWRYVKASDKKGLVRMSEGDGSFGSIKVYNYGGTTGDEGES